jgi:hypothetical protein
LIATPTPFISISQSYSDYPCLVMNTDTMALSEYTNYDFIAFAKFGDIQLSLHHDGSIYVLGGDTDAGNDIDAVVETGMDDMGSAKSKRLLSVTVGLRSDGEMQYRPHRFNEYGEYVTIESTDEEVIETRKLRAEKTKLSRVFGIEMSNVDGSDFSIDSMELDVRLSPRRSGGA